MRLNTRYSLLGCHHSDASLLKCSNSDSFAVLLLLLLLVDDLAVVLRCCLHAWQMRVRPLIRRFILRDAWLRPSRSNALLHLGFAPKIAQLGRQPSGISVVFQWAGFCCETGAEPDQSATTAFFLFESFT